MVLRHRPTARALLRDATLAGVVIVVAGCRSPGSYRAEADRRATDIIEGAQLAALGRTEPFRLERPSDTLRRRLLLDQGLATSSDASLGTGDLTPVEHWPDSGYLEDPGPDVGLGVDQDTASPVTLGLLDALAVAARNSREYQTRKESVFLSALDLDLARHDFGTQFSGGTSGEFLADLTDHDEIVGLGATPELSFTKRLENGMSIAGAIGIDLVRLLEPGSDSSSGLFGDLSISIPLMRGSGRDIVREPLTQAERNTIYAIYDFERFKREFAVSIASDYLGVLQTLDRVTNAEANYRSLISSSRRLRRLADEGRLPEIEVDQAKQNELQARDRWISAQQAHERALDNFRITLGLPTDAAVHLDRGEIQRLAQTLSSVMSGAGTAEDAGPPGSEPTGETTADAAVDTGLDADIVLEPPSKEGAGPYEFDEPVAVRLAFENRLDLRHTEGRVVDAERRVVVAADQLRAEVTLLGSASLGESRSITGAGAPDSGSLRPKDGRYDALLTIDLPLDRVPERNAYRESLINLESSVRDLQALEDSIKADVRERLRTLLNSREALRIQAASVELATRRVASTRAFLDLGRAQTRDLLEAQDDLLTAQNALTGALISYRIAELELQRDAGVLMVNEDALWTEYDPGSLDAPPAADEPDPAPAAESPRS